MYLGRLFGSLLLFLSIPLLGQIDSQQESHILYLIRSGKIETGLILYQQLQEHSHNFSLLRQIGYLLLSQGAKSRDPESQLITMYGMREAAIEEVTSLYRLALESPHPTIQLATIQFLANSFDNRAETLLLSAFSSPFLLSRLEASYALSLKKSDLAVPLIHNLMEKLPPSFHPFFPHLFARVGSSHAMQILHQLLHSPHIETRLAAIDAVAQFQLDHFLPTIRSQASHSDYAQQEICAKALGELGDTSSIKRLQTLALSPHKMTALSALFSLVKLGEEEAQKTIKKRAQMGELLAIPLLAELPNTEKLLKNLCQDSNLDIRLNAAFALLQKRSTDALPTLLEVMNIDSQGLGISPSYSVGRSLAAWKTVPLSQMTQKRSSPSAVLANTLALKNAILTQALELPEEAFLSLAHTIFFHKKKPLIPFVVRLLENLHSEKAILLLKEQAKRLGAPLIRNYCHLALYRMGIKNPHKRFLLDWLQNQKTLPLFQFREPLSWTEVAYPSIPLSYFSLTPRESSLLALEIFEALTRENDLEGLHVLLDALTHGHEKNRYVLAGFLLKTLQ